MTFGPRQIRAHAEAAWADAPDAPLVAFHLTEKPRHLDPVEVAAGADAAARQARVVWAESELAIRFALREASAESPVVLFTPVHEHELAADVRVRLPHRHLRAADPWEAARVRFRAVAVAPSLRRLRSLAGSLLAIDDDRWFAAAAGGTLTDELAWSALLGWMSDGALPAPADAAPGELHARLLDGAAPMVRRAGMVAAETRDALADWLGEAAGAVGRVLGAVVRYAEGADPDALLHTAIFAEAVHHAATRGGVEATAVAIARDRMRQPLQIEFDDRQFAGLARAARAWFDRGLQHGRDVDVADTLAAARAAGEALGDASLWAWSGLTAEGFAGALARLAEAVSAARVDGMGDDGDASGDAHVAHRRTIAAALGDVANHRAARHDAHAVEAARALARLAARRLQGDDDEPAAGEVAASLARGQVADGAWVDRLRYALEVGTVPAPLAEAAARECAAWRARVAARNAAFATAVAAELADGDLPAGMLPQESVLDAVVVPLVKAGDPVLLVVMDGMSHANATRLVGAIADRWSVCAWAPGHEGAVTPMLTVLPSITECARTSLLCGRVTRGGQADESKGLKHHPGLHRAGASTALLHKGDLDASTAADLADAVGSGAPAVVACVVNAIDDQLAGSNQVAMQWTVDGIQPLRTLLDAAFDAGRTVVFTSDHGHVWQHGTERLRSGISARHRADDGPASDGEVRVTGPRVKAATGDDAVVLLHREDARYTQKPTAGYHGGLTLQEATAPLVVFRAERPTFDGWAAIEVDPSPPAWWSVDAPPAERLVLQRETSPASPGGPVQTATTEATPASPATATESAQTSLLPTPAPPSAAPAAEPAASIVPPPEILRLLETPAFIAAVDRVFVKDRDRNRAHDLLAALGQLGGRAPLRSIGEAIGVRERRVTGLVAQVQKVVNLDGFQALFVDREEQAVVLDIERVCRQYGVPTE